MSAPSHYQLLGLPVNASADALRQAFRQLSKRYHPDTTTLPLSQAAAAFRDLQRAYGVLSDPEQRRHYDHQLLAEQMAQPVAPPMAPAQPLDQRQRPVLQAPRRPLSGGEWLALLLLVVAALFSLLLGLGAAWLRGVDLVQWPSWWLEAR
ncbi:MAG: J domain-containing protein [Cyanobacteriota bacterium]|nr:J domain-containing protein [Cyanobacteriota bacterium]